MSGGVWVVSGWCLRVSGRCLGCMDVIWIENNWTRVIIWICFLFSQWPPGAEKEQNDHFTLFTVPVADFCSKWPVLVHYKVLGGGHLQILNSPIYQYTLFSASASTGLSELFVKEPLPSDFDKPPKTKLLSWKQRTQDFLYILVLKSDMFFATFSAHNSSCKCILTGMSKMYWCSS